MDGACVPHGGPYSCRCLHSCSYWTCAHCPLNPLCPSLWTSSGKSLGVGQHVSLSPGGSHWHACFCRRQRRNRSFLRPNGWLPFWLCSCLLAYGFYCRAVSRYSYLGDSQRPYWIACYLQPRCSLAQDGYP